MNNRVYFSKLSTEKKAGDGNEFQGCLGPVLTSSKLLLCNEAIMAFYDPLWLFAQPDLEAAATDFGRDLGS